MAKHKLQYFTLFLHIIFSSLIEGELWHNGKIAAIWPDGHGLKSQK